MPARVPAVLRIAVAALTAAALGFIAYRASLNGGLANFFSYFTVESNILGTLVFAAGGIAALAGRRPVPDLLRGAAALYLIITGIVFAVALAKYDNPSVIPWTDAVVHKVTPIAVALDWLADPPRRPPAFPRALTWMLLPLLYLPYTLVRGPIAQWYPYPFLDPRSRGYLHVAVSSIIVTAAFLAAAAVLCWAGKQMRARRRIASESSVKPAHMQH
jgi:hypothetical protein